MEDAHNLESSVTANRNTEAAYSPNNPPWGGWAAFGVWVASILFIVVFQNLFLAPYVFASKVPLNDPNAILEFSKTDPIAVLLTFVSVIPAHIFTFVLAWLVVTRFRRFSFREMLGWEWGGFKVWHAVALSVLFYLIALGAVQIFGDVENDLDRMLRSSWYIKYVVAVIAILSAPLVEEVVYRGVLYSAFQRAFGVVIAVVAVTLLFSLVHVAQYSQNATPDYAVMSVLTLLSLLLTLVRVWTGNLLPCIVLHLVFNSFQSVVMIAEPYLSAQ
ncbi:CPBP family intramembrane glutamic endopeptidase [Leptolyngbya sp. 7M]|uniref:CPBP family intramembrane glutamic endopeptidase n=1 Tax=Leptolyngbya sp. 7M TaxID=2812896 RepID=UPI001B8A8F28|nr:CPBP family intramembrane glutamic endopeptidase [Leptolyngbya sp. 7M]QYO66973.1 CPBP family intramembrane metalloprotease [Leptolyngbya sp. 7M]